ncbi:NUDIX hydrolase [Leisingera caerulea]|uniref:NUDIX hydrolase n=1 Tax=Leisingera caerulea TaxID=506591 RepID=A0A9Q9HLC4_LEICA|nr:NUDIX hydrolase [Leisingera caerulea]UWQ50832.1 NUDIX hydrolase [Leisingera caerulea]UWQ54901.1 NUDIX hydrolase [Leisingera caerulea]UWQ59528.1 NUDIX hydrolase [Leisingera caerulea]UWQ63653.1 NUDIX hydrolase [Leisingera caerulea]
MTRTLTRAWEEILRPMLKRPNRLQVAALCYRTGADGKEVLMITSRGTGRWIIPKGWPVEGKDGPASALQEAWEEAGVRSASVSKQPIGEYNYVKRRDHGVDEPVTTLIFSAEVETLAEDYPESDQRKRQWMRPEEAAELVQEPQLQALLRQL